MNQTVILHSDLNNFYASVECLYRPELRDKPMAVGGEPEKRHGIILAKNYLAKSFGIKTGEAIWQARQKCPDLIVVPPNFALYLRFSKLVRNIYYNYTDQVEPFGLDEAWLDVSGSNIFGDGVSIADKIRERIKSELGVTASVGVSFNKVFAKLGSDMKKPDATTVITRDNYKSKIWHLPASDLLYVGPATSRKLTRYGINTIGDLALANLDLLHNMLGKWGGVLWAFANGYDKSPVMPMGEESIIKSVGNSTTTPRDLQNDEDVEKILMILCESIAARLREQGFKCRTVQIHIRDNNLYSFTFQGKLSQPTNLATELLAKAIGLFKANYLWLQPIRSLGVRGCDLIVNHPDRQLSLFNDEEKRLKEEKLEATVDDLRYRFGHAAIQRAVLLNSDLGSINPKDDHIIHPVAFFKEGKLPNYT